MNKPQKLIAIKKDLGKSYKSKCRVCHTKDSNWKTRRGFTIHHKWYIENERIHSDFSDSLTYYEYLYPKVKAYPRRFMYLCNKCHYALTKAIQYSDKIWKRLSAARRESRRE